jgi:hypothetical protein
MNDVARFLAVRQSKLTRRAFLPDGLIDWSGLEMLDIVEDIAKDLVGPLVGVDVGDELGAVEIEDGLGFFLVNLQAALDDLFVDVVEPVVFEGTAFQAVVDLGSVGTGEMEDAVHFELGTEDFGLVAIAGYAVEHKEIDVGLEAAGSDHGVDLRRPEADADVVGHELAFARIMEKGLAKVGAHIDRTKDVAAGAMIKAGDGAKNFALGSFAGSRGTEKKKGFVNHD